MFAGRRGKERKRSGKRTRGWKEESKKPEEEKEKAIFVDGRVYPARFGDIFLVEERRNGWRRQSLLMTSMTDMVVYVHVHHNPAT